MSAIRESVKVLNRRGVFSVTKRRAFCTGGMKTEEVQEKDLFITKVHSDDIQVFQTGASNAKYFDLIKPSIATTGRGDSLHGGLHGGDQDAGIQGGEARRQPSRRRLSGPLLSRSQPTRPLCQGTAYIYLPVFFALWRCTISRVLILYHFSCTQDIKSGNCDPSAEPIVLKESAATAWVDGNNGLGVIVGEFS